MKTFIVVLLILSVCGVCLAKQVFNVTVQVEVPDEPSRNITMTVPSATAEWDNQTVTNILPYFPPATMPELKLDDFGRAKPQVCGCTAMGCGGEPCNTCTCDDGKTYKSW